MNYKALFICIFFIFLSCEKHKTNTVETPITIVNTVETNAVKWFKSEGTGIITGIAKFKPKKGEIRYGNEFTIELMPSNSYTEERLKHIYKNTQSGFVHVEDGVPTFTPDPEAYHDTKKTTCDELGKFEYTNLPAGDYYVIAFMLWDKTGGGLMQRITLLEGEKTHIEMTNF